MKITLAAVMLVFIPVVFAADARIAWDHNPANAAGLVAGYQLMYGDVSGNHPITVDVGVATQHTISNLSEGKRYFFAVRAYNIGKTAFSPKSAEVSKDFSVLMIHAPITIRICPTSAPC